MINGKKDYITQEEAVQFMMDKFKCDQERAEELVEQFMRDCPHAVHDVEVH